MENTYSVLSDIEWIKEEIQDLEKQWNETPEEDAVNRERIDERIIAARRIYVELQKIPVH